MSESASELECQSAIAAPVVIGSGACFDGTLSFWGSARVDGALRGQVFGDGVLEVGPDANVVARIELDVLIVEGVVDGDVVARERVEIRSGGRIAAAIRTPRLVLAEGGSLEGRLTMTGRAGASVPDTATAA